MDKALYSGLVTPRLILTRYRSDYARYVEEFMRHGEDLRVMGGGSVKGKEVEAISRAYVRDNQESFDKRSKDGVRLAIVCTVTREFVGNVSVYQRGEYLELGFWIMPSYRRRHYGEEVVKFLSDMLTERGHSLEIRASSLSVASGQIAESAGYRRVGVGHDKDLSFVLYRRDA